MSPSEAGHEERSRAALRELSETLIAGARPDHSLRPEVLGMVEIFERFGPLRTPRHDDISAGQSRTRHGLAISPRMAAMCSDDYVRTIRFARGLHAAIVDLHGTHPDRPVRVLYVGCGPYATLAIPAMMLLPASTARFVLLDLHSESIDSCRSIVRTLGLTDRVEGFETANALTYRIPAENPPDVIVIETMNAALENEPQVAITRHLLAQAPEAVLVPDEIRIDLVLVDPDVEFSAGSGEETRHPASDRIVVGTAFTLNVPQVRGWRDKSRSRLEGSTLELPSSLDRRNRPMLVTSIEIYGEQTLEDRESGLTRIRALRTDDPLEGHNQVRFRYVVDEKPRLVAEIVAPARA